MKFRLKTSNFAIFFAKKPDKTNTTKHVTTYVQMRIEPYIFTKLFQKTYKHFRALTRHVALPYIARKNTPQTNYNFFINYSLFALLVRPFMLK